MSGFHETFLSGKVRHQQFVHQINEVFARMFPGESFVLLKPVDEWNKYLCLLGGRTVHEVKKRFGSCQRLLCSGLFFARIFFTAFSIYIISLVSLNIC